MKITEAHPLDHFRVSLRFDDGVFGVVDLSHLAGRGVFQSWLLESVFEQVSISPAGALQWPGDIDLCPDSLYLRLNEKTAAEILPLMGHSLTHA